ncbi:pyridoxamine 5'-phosphate oxidase-domain-containing protein [Tuber borchii]|uniref:Pyridoxamine 5'-phosphate oxidase-domain-containing protein n=1 Tax=Tuber borchii TaxID=42251 RepID=A0A2T7A6Y0_TUBBO|nr:pyridoxamine 5'-phosphate oxidase-domain-containing protein [Tuber borchii]
MHFPLQHFLLALPLAIAHPCEDTTNIPTVQEAAVQARQLLRSEKIGTLSTVFPSSDARGLGGYPIGMTDYYADCSNNGNPTLLAIKIATSFKNARNGAPISLTLREHSPSSEFYSPAAHHRLSLIGRLSPPIPANSDEGRRVKACFTKAHPDAKWWVPGNPIHKSEWVTFEVERVYWVGGFGDREFIGDIPVELYRNVTLKEDQAVVVNGAIRFNIQQVWGRLRGMLRIE